LKGRIASVSRNAAGNLLSSTGKLFSSTGNVANKTSDALGKISDVGFNVMGKAMDVHPVLGVPMIGVAAASALPWGASRIAANMFNTVGNRLQKTGNRLSGKSVGGKRKTRRNRTRKNKKTKKSRHNRH
jgi:hypothetical protein